MSALYSPGRRSNHLWERGDAQCSRSADRACGDVGVGVARRSYSVSWWQCATKRRLRAHFVWACKDKGCDALRTIKQDFSPFRELVFPRGGLARWRAECDVGYAGTARDRRNLISPGEGASWRRALNKAALKSQLAGRMSGHADLKMHRLSSVGVAVGCGPVVASGRSYEQTSIKGLSPSTGQDSQCMTAYLSQL